jgi:hypothetical protein
MPCQRVYSSKYEEEEEVHTMLLEVIVINTFNTCDTFSRTPRVALRRGYGVQPYHSCCSPCMLEKPLVQAATQIVELTAVQIAVWRRRSGRRFQSPLVHFCITATGGIKTRRTADF